MAFTEGGSDGTANGVTPVTVVEAPAASTRRIVKTLTVFNADTATVTAALRKVSAGGTRILVKADLSPGDTLIWDNAVVLPATTDSITLVLSAAPATTQPDWTSTYADAT